MTLIAGPGRGKSIAYNAMIDRRPAAIALCVDVADVVATIKFAREHRLTVAMRGGGHDGGGLGVSDIRPTLDAEVVMRLIDVSHEITSGMVTYPGLPAPLICDYLSREASREHYSDGTTFQIGKIEMVANTGTYVDSPYHRYEDGVDLAELDLARLADVDGIVVDARNEGRALSSDIFRGLEVTRKAVLVLTGWDSHWATPAYGHGHPYLIRDAAELLVQGGASLVGIDSLNIDDTADGDRPVHTLLLGAGIPIVEHLCNLAALPASGFRFHAAPVKFRGVGSFPVRAYGIVT